MYTNQQFETNLTQPISSGPMGQIPGIKDFIIGRRNALQTQLAGFGCTMVVGMEEGMETSECKVYPNPTREKVFVDVPDFEGFMITLRNVHGQMVAVQQLDSPHQVIGLNLAQGMYFYSVENGVSVLQTGKILVE